MRWRVRRALAPQRVREPQAPADGPRTPPPSPPSSPGGGGADGQTMEGAALVAKAWEDPSFRATLLADPAAAIEQAGLSAVVHARGGVGSTRAGIAALKDPEATRRVLGGMVTVAGLSAFRGHQAAWLFSRRHVCVCVRPCE